MKFPVIRKQIAVFCLSLFCGLILSAGVFAAEVDVYGEGAVNGTTLNVYLYADVHVSSLVSYGVTLNYDPAELNVVAVEKDPTPVPYTSNTTKWYLGEETAAYRNNPAPDYSSPGEVMIIGGKLNPSQPAEGIPQGNRVLLAMISFNAAGNQMADNPTLFLSYARGDGTDDYKNFVRLNGTTPEVLDGTNVYFGAVTIAQLGDADANGVVSPRDINAVKSNIGNADAPCYVDCDGNGTITPRDINCLKTKI